MSSGGSQAAQEAKARAIAAYAKGVSALEAGDLAAAQETFAAIVRQYPRLHEVWNALCLVALRAAAPEMAVEHARRAVALDRTNVDYINNLGIAQGELGQFDAAEQAFRRAVRIKPGYVEGHFNLGKVLHKQGRLAESLKEYQRAHSLDPASVTAQQGLAELYQLHGQPGRALEMLRAGGAAERPGVLTNLYANSLADTEGPEAAVSWLRACLPREPGGRFTHGPLAVLLLSLGHWSEGWKYYCLFYRERRAPGSTPTFDPLPARLDGKRVLMRDEQGIGDILFFLRFAGELQQRGASLALNCPPRVAALLEGARAFSIAPDDAAEKGTWDWELWTTDLPALLKTESVPPPLALHLDETARERAREHLARLGPRPYLGVTWRAGRDMLRQREFAAGRAVLFKEVPVALLGRALRGWPGTLVSLQRGSTPQELHAFRAAVGMPVHDLTLADDDLRWIAAVVEQLDEYVAVSNTNIHMLAGLRRRARVLVPHPPHWRWMRQGDSVWFPGFPVYRQPQNRDWTEPLARLRADLFAPFSRT